MLSDGTVLVPLDGSNVAERALPYAASVAARLRRPLVLMMAAYLSDIPEHGPWSSDMVSHPRETGMAYLTAVREQHKLADAKLVVKVGYPHEAILEAAKEEGASLLAISTHGRSGFSRWVYGSTAGNLLHSSHFPVLVVGKNVRDAETASSFAPRRLLVPLDGSAASEEALSYASEIADAFDAGMTLMKVAPFSTEAFTMTVPQMYWPELDEELVRAASTYLEKVRSSMTRPVELKTAQGPRAESLMDAIESAGVDLVVMSTHGRAGLVRSVLGSTADRLLQGPAPVLLIRPQKY
jgi:nucleotide-binding universal stress UspA family protein